jgi:hypothetical protein
MKKLTLTIVCALAATGAAFAQGNVDWLGINPFAMTAQTNMTQASPLFGGGLTGTGTIGAAGGNASLGTGFYYELLYNTAFSGSQVAAPTTLAQLATWQDTGLTATNSYVAGRLAVVNGNTGAQVPWSPGTTNNIMLVGWSANLGTSWLSVSNKLANGNVFSTPYAFFGESATGYISPFSYIPGAPVFGIAPGAEGLPIFSLNTQLYILVPEPGTIALAGLGGLSLLLFRRRKQ